jgi:hypothetical protein
LSQRRRNAEIKNSTENIKRGNQNSTEDKAFFDFWVSAMPAARNAGTLGIPSIVMVVYAATESSTF